jgi:Ca2+:H+ antiporter
VHHAEVVALRVGEPFGTLILAIAVTVIEVGLILMLMTSSKGGETLARDTVFSAYMIVCNGVVGICLLVGALKHRVVSFRVEGVTAAVATLTAVATLALVLPTFTETTAGGTYSGAQLAFAGVASLALYGVFVFAQTVRHRDYFLPLPDADETPPDEALDEGEHANAPTDRQAMISLGLLLLCLVAVVGLAKTASPAIERAVTAAGAPEAVVGVCIALLVLAPETGAAVRAAARNRVQTSLNLAYGSSLATIGLTIPTIAVASIWINQPLTLGLGPLELVLLALTVVLSILTVAPGRATLMQASVHLAVFGTFLFFTVTP